MSKMLTAEIRDLFTTSKKGPILIIVIGNSFRSDDGVGPYIARQIKKCKKNFIILNAGNKPESVIGKAVQAKPGTVIIVDAANFGGMAGEIKLIEKNDIPDTSLSTHSFPLNIIARIIEAETGADVSFLGIQPKRVQLAEGLSKPVKRAAEKIISCIRSID
jgi:hydrogenase 3 maturation protease